MVVLKTQERKEIETQWANFPFQGSSEHNYNHAQVVKLAEILLRIVLLRVEVPIVLIDR